MKKKFLFFTILFLLIMLTSCGNNSIEVTYSSNKEILFIKEFSVNEPIDNIVLDDTNTHYFLGWYLDISDEQSYNFNSEVTENFVLYAKWFPKEFEVVIRDFDEAILNTYTILYDQEIETPKVADIIKIENKVYEFNYWEKDIDYDDKIITLWPIYNVRIEYEIKFFDMNDNLLEEHFLGEDTKIVHIDYEITDTIRYDYTFLGWTVDKESGVLFDFDLFVTSDLYLYPVYTKVKKDIDFNNMKVSFLGDSITTFYSPNSAVNSYYNQTNQYYYPTYSSTVKFVEDTWWYKFADMANLNIGINNSWSGSSLYNNGNNTNSAAMNMHRILSLNEAGNPDIIFVFIGTNDNVNGVSLFTFRESYKTLLRRLNETYPNSLVFTMTLGYSAYTGYNYTETTRLAYNEIIKEETNASDYYNIDISTIQTKDTYLSMLGDSLHPNLFGMNKYAEFVFDEFKKFF